MTAPCIITVAITGSLPRKNDNPAVPISITEQIESTHEAFEAGATLVHLHVRNDDETPTSAPDRFARVVEGIRRHCPGIITQVSTGGRSGAGPERGGMLSLKRHLWGVPDAKARFAEVQLLIEVSRQCVLKEVVAGLTRRRPTASALLAALAASRSP